MDKMTLTVILILTIAGLFIRSSAENYVESSNDVKTNLRNNGPCYEANVVCPEVDGPNVVYSPLPDCTKFCQCSNGVPYLMPCPDGLHFNPTLNVCDWPQDAGCVGGDATTTTTTIPSTTTTTPTTTTPSTTTPSTTTTTPTTTTPSTTTTTPTTTTPSTTTTTPTTTTPSTTTTTPTTTTPSTTTTTPTTEAVNTTTTEAVTTNQSTTPPASNTTELCLQTGIECPAVDGPDSVYGPGPECTNFCQCSNGVPYLMPCPGGLHFSPTTNTCTRPQNAGCNTGAGNTTTTTESTTTSQSTTPAESNTTTTEATTTSQSTTPSVSNSTELCLQTGIECPAVDGPDSVYGPGPECTNFCQCSNGVPYLMPCPGGLHFSTTTNTCTRPQNAGCNTGAGNTTTTTEATTTSQSTTPPSSNTTTTEAATTNQSTTSPTSNTTTTEATTTSQSTTPSASNSTELCLQTGIECPAVDGPDSVYGPGPECTNFCQCSNGVPYLMPCPGGLHFSTTTNTCTRPQNAGCNTGAVNSTTTTEATTTSQSTTPPSSNTTTTEAATTNQSTTPPTSNTTTTSQSTSPSASNSTELCLQTGIECPAVDGPDSVYGPGPECTNFCQCSNGVPYLMPCPGGLHFSTATNTCTRPQNAGCNTGAVNSTTTTEAVTTNQSTTPSTSNTSTTTEATTTSQSSTSPASNTTELCLQTGIDCPAVDGPDSVYGPGPECTNFCQCSNGVPYLMPCPDGLHFNPTLNVCDWPQNAGCTGGNTTTTQISTTTEVKEESTTVEAEKTTTEDAQETSTQETKETTTKEAVEITTEAAEETTTAEREETTTEEEITSTEGTTISQSSTPAASNSTGLCLQTGIECPAVDGPDSVYGPGPECTNFCQCSNGVPYLMPCPEGLHFNPTLNVCDWPQDAGCTGGNGTTTQISTTTEVKEESTTEEFSETTEAAGETTTEEAEETTTEGAEETTTEEADETTTEETTTDETTTEETTTEEVEETTTAAQPIPCSNVIITETITTTTVVTGTQYCLQNNISCPVDDEQESVYGALPDCSKFCQCSNGVPHLQSCPDGLYFNANLNVCDWPENSGCSNQQSTTSPNTVVETTTECSAETTTTEQVTTEETTTEEAKETTTDKAEESTTEESDTTTGEEISQSTTPAVSNGTELCLQTGIDCPAVDGPDSVYGPGPECSNFCQCSNGVPYLMPCPDGLHFNPTLNVCDWPQDAGCTGGNTSTEEESTTEEAVETTTEAADETTTEEAVEPTTEAAEETTTEEAVETTTKATEETTTEEVAEITTEGEITRTEGTTTSQSTTPAASNGTECLETGIECPAVDGPDSVYGPGPECTNFCQCSNGVPYLMPCPDGLHFNPTLNVCDWPQDAGCTGGNATTTQISTTTEKDTTTKTESSTTTQSSASNGTECLQTGIECPSVDGPDSVYGPGPECTNFCQCSNGVPYLMPCPEGLHFNPTLNICDWPQDAGCGGSTTVTGAAWLPA